VLGPRNFAQGKGYGERGHQHGNMHVANTKSSYNVEKGIWGGNYHDKGYVKGKAYPLG